MDTPEPCPHYAIHTGRDAIGPYAECEDCGECIDLEED